MMKLVMLLGAAASPTVFAQKATDGPAIPEGCVSYNDGCNTCSVSGGRLGACTMMMCFQQGTPYCSRYADGRTCTGPDACTDANSGGGQPEGARCSTSPTRGNPRGMPCARGLMCQIRDQGMIAADRPNSGVCVSPDHMIAVDPMPPMIVDPMPPTSTQMCPASPRQMCRMMCPPMNCPAGQCAMRTGSCCDFTCQSSTDAAVTVGGGGSSVTVSHGSSVTVSASSGACATRLATFRPMPGATMPQCDENGDFMPVQCSGSVGSCWCTTTDGTEIANTRVSTRNGQVLDISDCARAQHPDIAVDPVDPGFGMPMRQTVAQFGDRCAQGFCENPMDCPQCAAGLTCNVPAGMMCAGTCYGTCGKGH